MIRITPDYELMNEIYDNDEKEIEELGVYYEELIRYEEEMEEQNHTWDVNNSNEGYY